MAVMDGKVSFRAALGFSTAFALKSLDILKILDARDSYTILLSPSAEAA